ncbi:MAG: hypothetical protein K1060chlam4_00679 [Candidatus Anoxychlamydiales bacterium]|nr:hypothetical protein [Candidatus Anoxychlamydiales bacterium]NGX52010.1 hypothetical protein [Candidatus Anoxychlamydiales bacterium]
MDVVRAAKEIILKEIPKVIVIYVFGSYATKTENEKSDLDLAILCNQEIDKKNLWDISQKIASVANTEIDLIDLLDASTVFAFQIINESKIIYCLDEKKKTFFENKIDSMYLRLNDTRKDIIENIKKRKGVY